MAGWSGAEGALEQGRGGGAGGAGRLDWPALRAVLRALPDEEPWSEERADRVYARIQRTLARGRWRKQVAVGASLFLPPLAALASLRRRP